MSEEDPFPEGSNPPPPYEDIFASVGEPGDTSREDGDVWDEEVDPQLFASSDLFSADPPSGNGATPGGLIFPDLPALDNTTDLFGALGVANSSTTTPSGGAAATPSEDTAAPVSAVW